MHPIALLILVVVTAFVAFVATERWLKVNRLNAQLEAERNVHYDRLKDAQTKTALEVEALHKQLSAKNTEILKWENDHDEVCSIQRKAQSELDFANEQLSRVEGQLEHLVKSYDQIQNETVAEVERLKALHKRMTTRNRDPKTGKIVKWDWVSDESAAKSKPSHRLTHGLTVKNPTADEARAIFAEAKRLGIDTVFDDDKYPCLWYSPIDSVSRCAFGNNQTFVPASEFIARMQPQSNEG